MGLEETLIKLEEKRRDAWLQGDEKAFLELLADDFMEVNIFGRLDKDYICQNLFPYLELLKFEMSDFQMVKVGEDAAILTYHCYEKLKFKEDVVSGEFHVSAVYMKVNGDWKLLLWQITPFAGE